MPFITTQFDLDFEELHIKSEYHVVIAGYLEDLKFMVESSVGEYVNVTHTNNFTIDDKFNIVDCDAVDFDVVQYSTYDESINIWFRVTSSEIEVCKFECGNLTYEVIDDFINKFIYRVRRLYDIKYFKCYDIESVLLKEWFIKNNGTLHNSEYNREMAEIHNEIFDEYVRVSGTVNIDSVFIPEEYDINMRRKIFEYITNKLSFVLNSIVEKYIKQNIRVSVDSDYSLCEEYDDDYIGSISFKTYTSDVLCLEFFSDEINIIPLGSIKNINIFLDGIVSEVINFAKYFVDIKYLFVRSECSDEIVSWCEGSGFKREKSEDINWCTYKLLIGEHEGIDAVMKHPYKTLFLKISNHNDYDYFVDAVASLFSYELSDLRNDKWIPAMFNCGANAKEHKNIRRELKSIKSSNEDGTDRIIIIDEIDHRNISDNIRVVNTNSNMTVHIDKGVDIFILRAKDTARMLSVFNSDSELLLSLLLPGNDYVDIIYDARTNKYTTDNNNVKEMVFN